MASRVKLYFDIRGVFLTEGPDQIPNYPQLHLVDLVELSLEANCCQIILLCGKLRKNHLVNVVAAHSVRFQCTLYFWKAIKSDRKVNVSSEVLLCSCETFRETVRKRGQSWSKSEKEWETKAFVTDLSEKNLCHLPFADSYSSRTPMFACVLSCRTSEKIYVLFPAWSPFFFKLPNTVLPPPPSVVRIFACGVNFGRTTQSLLFTAAQSFV